MIPTIFFIALVASTFHNTQQKERDLVSYYREYIRTEKNVSDFGQFIKWLNRPQEKQ